MPATSALHNALTKELFGFEREREKEKKCSLGRSYCKMVRGSGVRTMGFSVEEIIFSRGFSKGSQTESGMYIWFEK